MRTGRKRLWEKVTAWMLVTAMVGNMAIPAYGYPKNKDSLLTVEGKEGEKITEDESWEERFPNGTFAFKNAYLYLHEGRTEAQKITVYRLGGTEGDAVANICVTPAVTQMDEGGTMNDAYAAGYDDFTIEVDSYVDADDEDTIGTPSDAAYESGDDASPSNSGSGKTKSGKSRQKTVKTMVDTSGMDPYDPLYIDLEFKDGEYAKDIIVKAIDDDLPETMEFALFTIYDCVGAEFTETANGMTLGIYDDEEEVDSTIGFEISEVRADKASGQAVITVTRSEGLPYVAQCGFRTVDGTAKAGRDYAKQEGVVTFAGGVDETEIVIELIDDDIITEDEVSFQVQLYEPKAAVIDKEANEATVYLYNSGEKNGKNLATMLYTPEADDVSSLLTVADEPMIQSEADPEVEVMTQEPLYAEADYDPSFGKYNPYQRTVSFGELSFNLSDAQKNQQWTAVYDLLKNKPTWDVYTPKESEADIKYTDKGEWQYFNKLEGRTSIAVEDIYERYSKLRTETKLRTHTRGLTETWYNIAYAYLGEVVAPVADMPGGDGLGAARAYSEALYTKEVAGNYSTNPNIIKTGPYIDILDGSIGDTGGFDSQEHTTYDEVNLSNYAQLAVNAGMYDTLNSKRNNIVGMVESQSDSKISGGVMFTSVLLDRIALQKNPKVLLHTADDAAYGYSTAAVDKLKPSITLDVSRGGINSYGKLFIGSTLYITDSSNMQPYAIYDTPFLADASGKILAKAEGDGKTKVLEIGVDSKIKPNQRLTAAGDYSINVILNRVQNVVLSYAKSVNAEGDTENTKKEVEDRLKNALANATITYRTVDGSRIGVDFYDPYKNQELYFKTETGKGNFRLDSGNQNFVRDNIQNIKSINFNLSEKDTILYNRNIYKGNETIDISVDDYKNSNISFAFYDEAHVNAVSKMTFTAINSVVTYLDKNNNNKIDPEERGEAPYQTLGSDTYSLADLGPVMVDGKRCQQIAEVEFDMTPRSLGIPVGKTGNEQCEIVPNFVTTVNKEATVVKLTKQMEDYRQIAGDNTKKYMYGQNGKNDSRTTITFPLGGDFNPPVYDKQSEKYTWTPQWKGNLSKPYDNPENIVLDDTAMPNGFVAASSKDTVNSYLGALQAHDTFSLMIFQNETGKETVDDTEAGPFRAIPDKGSTTINLDKKNAEVDTEGRPKQQPNLSNSEPGVELPNLNIPAGPLEFVMDENTLGLTLGVSLLSYSKDNSVKSNTETNEGVRNTYTQSKESINQLKSLLDFSKGNNENIFQKLKDYKNTNTGDLPGVNGGNSKPARKAFEIAASVSFSFMWEYSDQTNKFEFQSAGIFLNVGGSVTIKKYLDVCPIVYCYISFGASLDAGMGLEIKETVDKDGNRDTQVEFSGAQISLSVFMEAGAGLGIEVLSAEIFLRGSVTVGFILGQDGEDFEINQFITRAAVGFRVVLLAISFEMEAISIEVGYKADEQNKKNWYWKWTYFGNEGPGSGSMRRSLPAGDSVPGFKIKLPDNTYYGEGVYTPEDNLPKDKKTRSFHVDDMPFEVSGYSSSVSAAKLADGISLGSKYKMLTSKKADDTYEHYILYLASRNPEKNDEGIHATALMLSKIGYVEKDGKTVLGLLHPVDSTSQEPFMILDDDIYGDVDFGGSVTDGKLNAVWTSYTEDASKAIEKYKENANSEMAAAVMMSGLSGKTSVKSAVIDLVSENDQKHKVVTLATASEASPSNYRYLPQPVNEKTSLFVQTVPYTQEELKALQEKYRSYYESGDIGNDPSSDGTRTGDPYAEMKYEYQMNMAAVYGKTPGFGIATVNDERKAEYNVYSMEEWKNGTFRIDEVTTLATSSNAACVAYTVTEEEMPQNGDGYEDIIYVKKLYLQSVEFPGEDGTTARWGKPKAIRKIAYSENGTAQAGVYGADGAIESQTEGGYFANLKFLNADVGNGLENIFLFNMNGDSYYISEAGVEEVLSTDTPNTELVPVFSIKDKEEKKANTQNDVTISADPTGKLVAVYTDQVPNTTNNALYISRYELVEGKVEGQKVGIWSDPIMLAMNQMQVYEDSIRYGWNEEESTERYFLNKEGTALKEEVNKFVMSAPDVAVGIHNEQLVILFQGVHTPLSAFYYGVDEDGNVILKEDTDKKGNVKTSNTKTDELNLIQAIPDSKKPATTGFYALAYGVGSQAVGDARLTFMSNRFIAGERLLPSISFKNTGDAAIRGSNRNPIRVRLHISGEAVNPDSKTGTPADSEILAEWHIKANIPAGRSISISDMTATGQAKPLPRNLKGRVLYFTVNEDEEYITESPYSYSSFNEPDGAGKIVIKDNAELLIEDFSATGGAPEETRTRAGGLTMPLYVTMTVRNSGSKDTDDVRLKIGYTKQEDGKEVFYNIDDEGKFDSGISLQKQADGTFKLLQNNQPVSLKANGSILLNGSFQVSSDYFDNSKGVKGMKLSVELLTEDEEYDNTNNMVHQRVKTDTIINVPRQLNLIVNTPVYIPVEAVSMDDTTPQITVKEIAISGSDKILESVSYDPSAKKIMMVPKNTKSSSIVRITDSKTGSFKDIAINVLEEGVNIIKTNELLKIEGSWEDRSVPADAVLTQRPYMDDMTVGKKGGSFTFTTFADHIELYYEGKIKVSSVNGFGYTGGTSEANDMYSPTTILFGNDGLKEHTVTIEVESDTATFDRFIERYSSGGSPWEKDTQKPWIILGKSAPEKGSLKPGEVFHMPFYAVDDRNLSSVNANGGEVNLETEIFAWGTLSISENGTYKVIVTDGSGNVSEEEIKAEWFSTDATGAATSAWPKIKDVFLSGSDGIKDLTGTYLTVQYDKGSGKIQPWSQGEVTDQALETIETVAQNTKQITTLKELEKAGFYLIEVSGDGGAWTRRLYEVAAAGGPELVLKGSSNDNAKMFYSAGGKGKTALAEIAIYDGTDATGTRLVYKNDFAGESFYSGEFNKTAGGVYYMTAKDIDGKTSSRLYSPDALLKTIMVGDSPLEDFRQEKTDYEVWIEYGVKDPPQVTAEPKGAPGNYVINYKQATDFEAEGGNNVAVITVKEKETTRTYRITFRQLKCTCDIETLLLNDVPVTIGWDKDSVAVQLFAEASAGSCMVEDHKDSPINYEYALVESTGGASVSKDGTLTCSDSGEGIIKVTAWKADGNQKTVTAKYSSIKKIKTEVKVSDTDKKRKSGIAYVRTEKEAVSKYLVTDKDETMLIGTSQIIYEDEPDRLEESAVTLPAANDGYVFDHWEAEDKGMDGVTQIEGEKESSMKADRNRILTAYFKDITPPECTVTIDDQTWRTFINNITFGLFFKESTKAEIKADDNDVVETVEYFVSEKEMSKEELEAAKWLDTDGTVYIDPDQKAVLYAKATDRDGNYTIVNSQGIIVDATKPELHLPADMTEFSNQPVDILIQTGDNLAGIDTVTYTTDEAVPQKGTVELTNGQGTIRMEKEGDYTLHVTAKDRSGNERSGSTAVKIDLTVPELKVPADMTKFSNQPVDVLVEAGDNMAGIDTVTYTTDEAVPQKGTVTLVNGRGTIKMANEGVYTLHVTAKDQAGNVHSESMAVMVDLTNPELRVTRQSAKAQVPYRVEIEAADGLAGLKRVSYTTEENGPETTVVMKDGKGEIVTYKRDDFVLKIKAEDLSGNETVVSVPLSLAVQSGTGGNSGGSGSGSGSGTGSTAGPGKNAKTLTKRLHLEDGSLAVNVWVYENGQWYRAGENGFALTGWFKDPSDGYWYYLREDGTMATGWILLSDGYYYLNPVSPQQSGWIQNPATGQWLFTAGNGVDRPLGAMYANTVTPDGYRVDENGRWIQE